MKRYVLFVGHEANRTGASLELLHLLRWLQPRLRYRMEVWLLHGGPLVDAYRSVAPTTVLSQPLASLSIESMHPPDLLYLNTVVSAKILSLLPLAPAGVLTHVHELESVIHEYLTASELSFLLHRSHKFIVVSEGMRRLFHRKYAVQNEALSVVHEGIPPLDRDVEMEGLRVRRQLGIPPDAFVVGMAGVLSWRKGADLFLRVAQRLLRRGTGRPFHFLWVGGGDNAAPFLGHLRREHGFSPEHAACMHWVGERENALPFMAAMDALALTSREDPFPLVHLEAALLGKPIVCFRDAGGAEEWVGERGGFVVPFLDVEAMTERLLALSEDAALCVRLGDGARTFVQQHFLIDHTAPRILDAIETLLRDFPARGGANHRPAVDS